MAAVATAATLLSGCREKKPEPVPPPQSLLTQRTAADRGTQGNTAAADSPGQHRGVSEISWFQGTLEEAFSRHSDGARSSDDGRPLLSAEALLQ